MSTVSGSRVSAAAVALRSPSRFVASRLTARSAQIAVAVAVVPVGATAIGLAAMSDHLEQPVATALYRAYLAVVPMLVGLCWWRRRPASRFGPLLVVFGLAAWGVSWQSSNWPLLYDLGVLAEAPAVILTFYLFLAFPGGRLATVADRVLIGAWTALEVTAYLAFALSTPAFSGGGPLSGCAPACPRNLLDVGSDPDVVVFISRWEAYIGLTLTVAVLVVYVLRLLSASRPRRRSLIAVAATSLLFLPIFFVFHFARAILGLDAETLKDLSWFVLGARVLLPLGFLVALFQADLFAGAARGRLLEELVTKPTPERWRDAVARALDDPALRIGYWDAAAGHYRESGGAVLRPPGGAGRAWAAVDRGIHPVAGLDLDPVLAEDPELVLAATSATRLAVESGDLEGELRASRAQVLAAGDAARRGIERDLHDSAQQRLVALRIQLQLASEDIDEVEQRERIERLGVYVDEALEDVRSVGQGAFPAALRQHGLGPALQSVLRHSAIAFTVDDRWRHRHRDEVELTAYFCCLEALQNASKHAGSGAVARIQLTEGIGSVRLTIEDDGVGFELAGVDGGGTGLRNIADRIFAIGGTLRIDSGIGRGTRVIAELPA